MGKSEKRASVLIIALCWAAYTVAYIGRLNLNAYIEPIRDQLGASKTELGLVSSFFFFSYGAGQLFHGIMSKKYNTRYSVAAALIGSALVNLAMTFCGGAGTMKYVWLLNGFFQSILWSSVVKTLANRLSDDMLPKAIVVMSTPPALGTFLVYGLSALLSSMGVNYKTVFYIPAILLVFVGCAWFALTGKAKEKQSAVSTAEAAPEKKPLKLAPAFVFGAVLLVFAAVSNGFIKDGVTTWTPSILRESYGMKESLSILVTVVLPLIAIGGSWLSVALHKRQKNTSQLNGYLYFAEALILLFVMLSAKSTALKSPVLLIILFSISAMLMSAVNNVITSIIPLYMRDSMEPGLLAGVLDTFCYVGSMLSTGLLGYISDRSSWDGVFLCLFLFGAGAFAACAVSAVNIKRNSAAKL
jgi:OPA family glycerol-3-phosphate transporter-like MFS transporter